MRGNRWPLRLGMLLPLLLAGCGWWGEGDESFEDELPELNAAVEAESEAESESKSESEAESPSESAGQAEQAPEAASKDEAAAGNDASEGEPSEPPEPAAESAAPGSGIPLRKTVVQTLTQGDVETRTRLVLDMVVSLEERAEERRRFGVRYTRVRYSGEIDGERFEYDSQTHDGSSVPPRARVYRGLAGNGFYFWLGSRRGVRLVGFRQFLERCVAPLPPSDRRRVRERLSVGSDAEAVFRFVDDSVGLLASRRRDPSAGDPDVGTNWTVLREMRRSVPMTLLTEYTIESLSAEEARIQIRGSIGPAAGSASGSGGSGLAVQVRGGRSIGHCIIDRRTGLPRESHLVRLIEMQVQGGGASPFHQQKRVRTTIEPLPSAGSVSEARPEEPSPPQSASAN